MIIGGKDWNQDILIVAEIGNNHEGRFDVAQQLVRKAAECGVQAVKFQTFRAEHYVSRSDMNRFNRLKSFELTYDQFGQLADLAHSLGLLFISTPFDLASAAFLDTIVDALKVASGDNNFYPLIDRVARSGKPLIVSTGLSDEAQVERTVDRVRSKWTELGIQGQLALLHCICSYPVPEDQVNLRSIPFLSERFHCTVGYSDHAIGIDTAVAAVAVGAQIIEKHFTLDKQFSSYRDHQLSADPVDMRELVRRVRQMVSMLGSCEKRVQPCEEPMTASVRRSIAAALDLSAGKKIALSDLTWTRPAGGLPPGDEARVVGRTLRHTVRAGEPLRPEDVDLGLVKKLNDQ